MSILLVLALVMLLGLALEPAHRRRNPIDRRLGDLSDRDLERIRNELQARDVDPLPRRLGRRLVAAGGAVPFHRSRLTAADPSPGQARPELDVRPDYRDGLRAG